jgi:hypothetical protein
MKGEESSKDAFERWSNGLFGYLMERYHPSIHKWWVEGLDLSENSKSARCGLRCRLDFKNDSKESS